MIKEISKTKDSKSRSAQFKENDAVQSASDIGRSSYIAMQPIHTVQFTKKNETGLPDKLKAGVENLSGYSMDDVRVHYNSDKPQTVQALAYTQGTDIYVGPGQEKHLPHEAWHVVQQKEGRVKPTLQLKGIQVNDDKGLEHEADVMGEKATNVSTAMNDQVNMVKKEHYDAIQCMTENVFDIQEIDENGKVTPIDEAHKVTERPESPDGKMWSLKIEGVPPEGLKRDHIIPWATIRNYTYVIAKIGKYGKWIENAVITARNAKEKQDYISGGLIGNTEEEIIEASHITRGQKKVPSDLKNGAKEVIRIAVSWMPGNIVMAPANRTDDEKAGFDFPLLNICSEKINYFKAYIQMEEIIKEWVKNKKIDKFDKVKEINDILVKIAQRPNPYPYKAEQWRHDQRGYHVKRNRR